MDSRLTASLDFNAQALVLRAERQRLIASNIANADTPGYVARDIDFALALKAASASLNAAQTPAATQHMHLPLPRASEARGSGAGSHLVHARPSQTNLDRNTVDMDRERASFADNALRYEAALRFINGGVRTMLSAITGQ